MSIEGIEGIEGIVGIEERGPEEPGAAGGGPLDAHHLDDIARAKQVAARTWGRL